MKIGSCLARALPKPRTNTITISTHSLPSALPLAPITSTTKEPTLLQTLPTLLHIIMDINITDTELFTAFDIPRRFEMICTTCTVFDYVGCAICPACQMQWDAWGRDAYCD